MKINIIDNELQIICESEKDLELAQDWKNSNIRQYKHNDDIGYVIALDIQSVKLIHNEGNKMNDKDQAAIDQVASVSKHPHAAMIVKWLITGWDVEFQHAIGEWKISDFPTWSPGSKYRLIEPNPAKPAYRVYRSISSGNTYTRDSNGGERYDYLDGEGVVREWISDWIEYDPPKKWPTQLVERIAAINLEAAQWIVDHWDDLLDEKYTYKGKYSRDSERLDLMFDWEKTDFIFDWLNISDKLGE